MAKRVPSFESLAGEYAHLWDTIEFSGHMSGTVEWYAKRILRYRDSYVEIEEQTGVPWWFCGLLHGMECGFNFRQHLHNGDSLAGRTRRVPRGYPRSGSPPFTWEESALDALRIKGYDKVRNWSIENVAWLAENFNGWGYRLYHSETLSPYLWSGTTHYRRGKYVVDGRYSPTAVSKQAGVMAILKRLEAMTDEIKITRHFSSPEDVEIIHEPPAQAVPPPDPKPTLAKTSRKWSLIEWLRRIFMGSAVGTASVASLDNMQATKAYLDVVTSFVNSYGIFVLAFGCLAGYAVTVLIKKYMVEDVESGRYIPSGEALDD